MEPAFVEGLTFDDVLLVPRRSDVLPVDTDVRTRFSRRVSLKLPLVSAAMDTVTGWRLAVALAREGGLGVIHRNFDIEGQVREVELVKRSANGVILDPVTLPPTATMREAREIMASHNISGLPILEDGERVVGILTRRDCRFQTSDDTPVSRVMTSRNLVTAPPGTSLEEARTMLFQHKVEKLIIVDGEQRLRGLITMKDVLGLDAYPNAATDERGRLRVGAAIGVHDYDRAAGLVRAGVDVLVVDTAHGHTTNVIETVRLLKRHHDVDVVAGNVATAEAARDLVEVLECARAVRGSGVPVIADGGIRFSGDLVKALAAGASSAMLGSLFAGLEESPGERILYKGRTFKAVRGMGSIGAMMEGSKERYRQGHVKSADKLVPEGIEGMVPYKGELSAFVFQFVGGLRAGMGYCGARNIEQLWQQARFVRVTAAGMRESHPHDVTITKESPNYFHE